MPVLADNLGHSSLLLNFYAKKIQNTKGRGSNLHGNRENEKCLSKDCTCPTDPKWLQNSSNEQAHKIM